MYFLFIKVMDTDYKEDIFLALQSVGINKGSYFPSRNMDNSLSDEIPMFSGFFKTDEDKAKEQYIITSLVEDSETAQSLLDNLRHAGINIDEEPILRLILLPVAMVFDQGSGGLSKF